MKSVFASVAAIAAACSAPAAAGLLVKSANPADVHFANCDGYGGPGKKSDGITVGTWMFGLATTAVDQRRGKLQLGAAGIAACDTALADARLVPAFATRRGHLLQAKAVHQIAVGKLDDALATLALSDKAGAADGYFDLSVGQGNRALRATALHGLKRNAEAEAELAAMDRQRPYAVSQRQLAMRVRLQFSDERAQQERLLEQAIPLLPNAQHQLFWQAMVYSDFDRALAFAPMVSHDDPKKRGGWTGGDTAIRPYLDIIERSTFAGAQAYALYATGQIAQSAQSLKDAEARVAESMVPPPPPEKGEKLSKKVEQDFAMRKRAGETALKRLKDWKANIALRAQAPGMTLAELKETVTREKGSYPMLPDLVAHVKNDGLPQGGPVSAALKEFDETREKLRLKSARMDFEDLVRLLPRPETAMNQRAFRQEDGILGSGLDGYAVKRDNPPGAATVRFGTGAGTLAMADEGALLAAAYHTRKSGADAFVVDVREPIQRTTNITTCYYGCGPAVPNNSGYEVQLVVRTLGAPAPAADAKRALRAAEIIAALEPRLLAANRVQR
jgi:hypothetical protein